MNELHNVEYKKLKTNPTIDSEDSLFQLPFYKDEEYLSSLENYVSFIKACEGMVRRSKEYARYIKFLKETVGLTFCQVLSNIEDEFATIEMHHGPILTLYDYASIITEYRLAKGKKINTFIIADILLDEHFKNNVQVVMLSKTAHELAHDRQLFLNTNHGIGNLNRFLDKYSAGVLEEYKIRINNYIDRSDNQDSYDNKVLL